MLQLVDFYHFGFKRWLRRQPYTPFWIWKLTFICALRITFIRSILCQKFYPRKNKLTQVSVIATDVCLGRMGFWLASFRNEIIKWEHLKGSSHPLGFGCLSCFHPCFSHLPYLPHRPALITDSLNLENRRLQPASGFEGTDQCSWTREGGADLFMIFSNAWLLLLALIQCAPCLFPNHV